MDKVDVYIAGAMTGRFVREVLEERRFVKCVLETEGLTWYDPAKDEGLEKLNPKSLISNAFDKRRMTKFVKKDLAAVSNSRALLNINGDLSSDGATWEMAFAVYHRQIPVHIYAPKRVAGSKMSFTNILVDGLHDDLIKAVKAVKLAIRRND